MRGRPPVPDLQLGFAVRHVHPPQLRRVREGQGLLARRRLPLRQDRQQAGAEDAQGLPEELGRAEHRPLPQLPGLPEVHHCQQIPVRVGRRRDVRVVWTVQRRFHFWKGQIERQTMRRNRGCAWIKDTLCRTLFKLYSSLFYRPIPPTFFLIG